MSFIGLMKDSWMHAARSFVLHTACEGQFHGTGARFCLSSG
ncbi:hypothetical protein AB434_2258 [Heyndrickxia coagulans]|uniref:Uncharacterized protein n=1 Tax=Heyndrickxia coagulans TaxID=1398 RepID=A0AAN0WCU0_HEYCO|nr:hypothetical protein SB48_HM08orf04886 [Heyndrickxia coagulans]AKN54663.1 hypothetical protein AB434_2258 [Heyndrickxia coagulans]KYC73638.1 hypothetical protein B4096_0378 [Heyndrickxia coagulans]